MSLTKNKCRRCDWCGKITRNQNGEYTRPDGVSAGYIRQPTWERFPAGDETSTNQVQSENDICEECEADLCPGCGSDQVVNIAPAIPGPTGWGGRCKACGYQWGMPDPLHGEQAQLSAIARVATHQTPPVRRSTDGL